MAGFCGGFSHKSMLYVVDCVEMICMDTDRWRGSGGVGSRAGEG